MYGLLLVVLTRVFSGLLIFRFPLSGYLLSIFFDITDIWIFEIFNSSFGVYYQQIDKILDFAVFITAVIASKQLDKLSNRVCYILFSWRTIGFIIFEITGIRWLFLIFPNLLENFFLFSFIKKRFFPKFKVNKKNILWILLILLIPKLLHEWFLHVSGGDMLVYHWVVRTIEKLGLRRG